MNTTFGNLLREIGRDNGKWGKFGKYNIFSFCSMAIVAIGGSVNGYIQNMRMRSSRSTSMAKTLSESGRRPFYTRDLYIVGG
jgi:hypothetical protein